MNTQKPEFGSASLEVTYQLGFPANENVREKVRIYFCILQLFLRKMRHFRFFFTKQINAKIHEKSKNVDIFLFTECEKISRNDIPILLENQIPTDITISYIIERI